MRYTTKDGKIAYMYSERNDPMKNDYKQDFANQKLCALENIEEELGIDLITLFKALKNGVWYKDFYGCIEYFKVGRHYFIDIDMFEKGINLMWVEECLEENNCACIALLYIKDYGKTWALRKEELLWNQY